MNNPGDQTASTVIPVIEEELVAKSHAVKTGSIRVHKRVERIGRMVEMPAVRDVVRVTRVTLNRPVSAMPAIREEGDILIIPVVEEEVVVSKRLVLKEEIHVHRRRVRGRVSKSVMLSREHADIEKLNADGEVVGRSEAGLREGKPVLSDLPKSILR